MKTARLQLWLLVTLILALTQTVSATTITVERSFNVILGNQFYGPGPSITWTFDLRPMGFDADTQDIISAILTLNLSDYTGGHGGEHGAHEYALLTAGGHWYGAWEVNDGQYSFALNNSLDDLSDHGTIPITLRATDGDFRLHSARLVVDAEPQASPAPEPGSIALVGLGLAGCFAMRRASVGRTQSHGACGRSDADHRGWLGAPSRGRG